MLWDLPFNFVSTQSLLNHLNERLIVNFEQITLSVRRCLEPMNRVCRLKVKVKVNFQGHGIYPLQFLFAQYLLNSLNDFIKLHPKFPFGETVCRTHGVAMQSRGQCHSSRSQDLPLKLVSATYLLNPFKVFH